MVTQNLAQQVQPSKSVAVIPIGAKKARPGRANRSRMAFLAPEETLAALKAARNRSDRDWALILVAYRHGLRASEVCGLRLADIDLKAVDLGPASQGLSADCSASLPASRPAFA